MQATSLIETDNVGRPRDEIAAAWAGVEDWNDMRGHNKGLLATMSVLERNVDDLKKGIIEAQKAAEVNVGAVIDNYNAMVRAEGMRKQGNGFADPIPSPIESENE